MKKIIFLTDLENWEKEDLLTIDFLRKYYIVDIWYIDIDYNELFNYDLIILRNTWPNNDKNLLNYNKQKKKILDFIEENNLKIYNELKSDFDRKGKIYLVDLYKKWYDVVPSFFDLSSLDNNINEFILKPINWFSSYWQRFLNKQDIKSLSLNNYIIQPKLNFQYELSFYFINNKFLYSLIFFPSKIPEWPIPIVYKPTDTELNKAKEFVNLNKMKKWISRIDFLKFKNWNIKLLEIEDDSPYFSITEIPKELQLLFLKEFKIAINNFIN